MKGGVYTPAIVFPGVITMSTHAANLQELQATTRKLAAELGPVMAGFGQLHRAAFGAGALDSKTKELIALSIGITSRCEGCIAFHVHSAVKAGASRAEVVEAIGVAIAMGGGPATVYGAEAFRALEEFHPA